MRKLLSSVLLTLVFIIIISSPNSDKENNTIDLCNDFVLRI